MGNACLTGCSLRRKPLHNRIKSITSFPLVVLIRGCWPDHVIYNPITTIPQPETQALMKKVEVKVPIMATSHRHTKGCAVPCWLPTIGTISIMACM